MVYTTERIDQSLNYLDNATKLSKLPEDYNLVKYQAQGILGQFRMFHDREVYDFYLSQYLNIVDRKNDKPDSTKKNVRPTRGIHW